MSRHPQLQLQLLLGSFPVSLGRGLVVGVSGDWWVSGWVVGSLDGEGRYVCVWLRLEFGLRVA